MVKAALYSRVSSAEDEVTAKRHEAAARKLAKDRGWTTTLYRDNDVSATSGARRPEWERMLADIEAGTVSAVVAYSSSRMYRRPRDLEPLIELVKSHEIEIATCASGNIDLTNAQGRMVAGILAQVDQAEAEVIGERQKLKALENARLGRPHGHQRPFGYQYVDKNYIIDPTEAKGRSEHRLRGRRLRAVGYEL